MSTVDIPHFSLHEQFADHGFATCHGALPLPRTWAAQLRNYASNFLDGTMTQPLAQLFPWLYSWYCDVVAHLVDVTFQTQVALAPLDRCLTLHLGLGRGYQTKEERERDLAGPATKPGVSGVLFACHLPETHGGSLELHLPKQPPALIAPIEGLLVLFDGSVTKYLLRPVMRALDVCYAVVIEFAHDLLTLPVPHVEAGIVARVLI